MREKEINFGIMGKFSGNHWNIVWVELHPKDDRDRCFELTIDFDRVEPLDGLFKLSNTVSYFKDGLKVWGNDKLVDASNEEMRAMIAFIKDMSG